MSKKHLITIFSLAILSIGMAVLVFAQMTDDTNTEPLPDTNTTSETDTSLDTDTSWDKDTSSDTDTSWDNTDTSWDDTDTSWEEDKSWEEDTSWEEDKSWDESGDKSWEEDKSWDEGTSWQEDESWNETGNESWEEDKSWKDKSWHEDKDESWGAEGLLDTKPASRIKEFFNIEPKDEHFDMGPEIDFENFMPYECQEAGITDPKECDRMMFSMHMPPECQEAGVTSPEKCEQVMIQIYMPTACKEARVATKEECERIMMEKHMPSDCKEAGITDMNECETHMMKTYSPKVCQEAGAFTDADCEKIVFAAHGRPQECEGLLDAECRELVISGQVQDLEFMNKLNNDLPPKCVELGAKTFEECDRLSMEKNIPTECKEAGAFTRQACEKVMMEKYTPSPEFLPHDCQEAGVTDPDECGRLMDAKYLPQECKDVGIDNHQECEIFLSQKYLPFECKEAGATTKEACEGLMKMKYMTPECKESGITDEYACERIMMNKYAKNIECEGISEDECQIAVSKRHLGMVVQKQKVFEGVRQELTPLIGKHIDIDSGQTEEIEKVLPLVPTDEVGLLIIPIEEEVVITEEENLIQTLPAAIMFDADQDGLPDDIEKNLGTNLGASDTDNDGYTDLDELKNGYDPLSEGRFIGELAPIEEAIINQAQLEQPIITGQISPELSVDKIENITAEENEENIVGQKLSGTAPPDSVVTVYLYSDLPIVVTTRVDQYGNWEYLLQESLLDDDHEVYVTVNDNTGKITGKSDPLSFFIQEARAISPEDFVKIQRQSAAASAQAKIQIYLAIAVALIIIAIILFVYFLKAKGKSPNEETQL